MLVTGLTTAIRRLTAMSLERIKVMEYELKAVRALRGSPNKALVREVLTREEELEMQIELLKGPTELAAGFVGGREADPDEKHGGAE